MDRGIFFLLWVFFMTSEMVVADDKAVHILVNNIEVARGGSVTVYIFGPDGYPIQHGKALQHQTKVAVNDTLEFSFHTEEIEFAVKAHHDEDSNGIVTKNWTGLIPAEGLAFSNAQKLTWAGPPTYRKSKLIQSDIDGPINVVIHYP